MTSPPEQFVRQVVADAGIPEWSEYVRTKALPAARCVLEPLSDDGGIAQGESRFGGHPDVPAAFAWPRTRTKRLLTFISQVDLSACFSAFGPSTELPRNGHLLLFFDARHSEGLEDTPQDHDRFKLYYFPPGTPLRRLARPKPLVDPDPSPVPTLQLHRSCFVHEWTLPVGLARDQPPAVRAAWPRVVRAFEAAGGRGPLHRVSGHPAPLQDCPFWLCSLNRSGLSHDLLSPRHPAVDEAEREVGEWRLVMQIEGDERLGFYPSCDHSRLFVCATAESIRSARFDRYWVSTQGT